MRIWAAAEVEVAGRILFLAVCSTGFALSRAILAVVAAVAVFDLDHLRRMYTCRNASRSDRRYCCCSRNKGWRLLLLPRMINRPRSLSIVMVGHDDREACPEQPALRMMKASEPWQLWWW